jgi:hypothetical protein
MAKADDTTSTSNRISWGETLARAGSSEALLSFLREVPILAWHQGLYYWPSGRTRSGPGKIDPDSGPQWAEARVDPATRRVIFLMDDIVSSMIAGDGPSTKDEVFAFGIELERGVVETRFPAQPNPPEPEHVEAPEQKRHAPQGDRLDQAILDCFPNGTDGIPTKAVHRAVVELLKPDSRKKGLADPSPTTVARKLGRRKK